MSEPFRRQGAFGHEGKCLAEVLKSEGLGDRPAPVIEVPASVGLQLLLHFRRFQLNPIRHLFLPCVPVLNEYDMAKVSVLFVCLGNICRSPLAEGLFRHIVETANFEHAIVCDSAGTGGWHAGEPPDRRSIAVAATHGIDLSSLRARQVRTSDFSAFDLIIGMDSSNVANLRRLAPKDAIGRVHLFSQVSTGQAIDVPDPYYGGPKDFEHVYHMVSEGCRSLFERLKSSDMSLSGNTSSVR